MKQTVNHIKGGGLDATDRWADSFEPSMSEGGVMLPTTLSIESGAFSGVPEGGVAVAILEAVQ